MKTIGPKTTVFLPTLIGAMAGFLFLHPYAMLVYKLHEANEAAPGELYRAALNSFQPGMLHMGIPFALLGGAVGLMFGLLHSSERKRAELKRQLERWTR